MGERLSQSELRDRIEEASQCVMVGARYQHYKGGEYTVKDLALIEATNEPAVIYQAEYGERITFIRPLADWLAEVEYAGTSMPRFALLSE